MFASDGFHWIPMPTRPKRRVSFGPSLLLPPQPIAPRGEERPEPEPATPADLIQRAGAVPVAGLYRDSILARIRKDLDTLNKRFREAASSRPPNMLAVSRILREYDDVIATGALAGRLAGMLTPWTPKLNTEVPTSERPAAIDQQARRMAIGEWPIFEQAMAWLSETIGFAPSTLQRMAEAERVGARLLGGRMRSRISSNLRQQLVDSIRLGESSRDWQKRLDAIGADLGYYSETLARTAQHGAYITGQREVLAQPVIVDLFPYRQYFATLDLRVRESHAEMNRWVYHKDSPLARRAQAQLMDYNCRCSEIPLTEEQAIDIGIALDGEPPGGLVSQAAGVAA